MNRRLIAAVGLTLGVGTLAPYALAADPTSTPFTDRDEPNLVAQGPLPPDEVQFAPDAASSTPMEVQAAPAPSPGEVYVAPTLPQENATVGTPSTAAVVTTPQTETVVTTPGAATVATAPDITVRDANPASVEHDAWVSNAARADDWYATHATVVNGEVVRPHTGAVEEEGHLVLTFPSRGAGTAEGYSP